MEAPSSGTDPDYSAQCKVWNMFGLFDAKAANILIWYSERAHCLWVNEREGGGGVLNGVCVCVCVWLVGC